MTRMLRGVETPGYYQASLAGRTLGREVPGQCPNITLTTRPVPEEH